MRTLTLHEKISVRGVLATRGVYGPNVVKASTRQLVAWWHYCCGRSIAQFYLYR